MKRPILIITLGYIIGIIIGLYCKISIAFFYLVIIPFYIFLEKWIKEDTNRRRYYERLIDKKIIPIIVFVSLISNTVVLYQNYYYDTKYEKIEKADFIATIVSDKTEKDNYVQYKIKIESVNKERSFKNTYLLLNLKENKDFCYGDRISFLGEYETPEGQRNYKGFSYRNYLKSMGIHGKVKADFVEKIGREKGKIFSKIALSFRKKIKENIRKNIKEEEKRNILLGILLGYDEELSEDIKNDFSGSGLSHILAVSGLHIAYFLMGIEYALKKCKCSFKIKVVMMIIVVIFLGLLTGGTPSIKRAVIMTILSLGAKLVYRKSDTITNLSFALLLLLIQNPFRILNTGLILSFLATAGIVYLAPFFLKETHEEKTSKLPQKKSKFQKKRKKIKETIWVSISAQLFLFPVNLLFFHKITLSFLFSNLLVSPLMGSILVLGVITSIFPNPFLISILNLLLEGILQIARFLAKLPISKIILTTPSIFIVILYYMILIVCKTMKELQQKEPKRRIEKKILTFVDNWKHRIFKQKMKVVGMLLLIFLILEGTKGYFSDLRIHFIDVGQGDATLMITPQNKTILLDGGGSKTFDVGKNTVLPYLLDRGISQIDYLMISHFDTDHVRFDSICIATNKSEKYNHRKTV